MYLPRHTSWERHWGRRNLKDQTSYNCFLLRSSLLFLKIIRKSLSNEHRSPNRKNHFHNQAVNFITEMKALGSRQGWEMWISSRKVDLKISTLCFDSKHVKKQWCESVTFRYGSTGLKDPYYWHTDPDPALFVYGFSMKSKWFFSITFWRYIYISLLR